MEINPGSKKVINETPRTSPLSAPIAKDKTSKNSKEEISGEKSVCAQTFKNLKDSFNNEIFYKYKNFTSSFQKTP